MSAVHVVRFTVHSRPVRWDRTAQDPRTLRRHHFERKAVTAGKADVAAAFEREARFSDLPEDAWPWQGPCGLKLLAVYQRPKDWWPGLECTKTPDLDNLAKLVQDALNGVAYRDDRQLVELNVRRAYGEREHSEIELRFWHNAPKPCECGCGQTARRDTRGNWGRYASDACWRKPAKRSAPAGPTLFDQTQSQNERTRA